MSIQWQRMLCYSPSLPPHMAGMLTSGYSWTSDATCIIYTSYCRPIFPDVKYLPGSEISVGKQCISLKSPMGNCLNYRSTERVFHTVYYDPLITSPASSEGALCSKSVLRSKRWPYVSLCIGLSGRGERTGVGDTD